MSETTWDRLISGDELKTIKRSRGIPFISKTIFASSLDDEKEDGWNFYANIKNSKKDKN